MGFKSVMKKIGKGALKVGKVAVPIALAATGVGLPAAVAASAALNAADKKASGGSWKQALISGGIGAGTSLIPGAGGVGGAVGGGVAKAGLKEIAGGLAKGAATNFATGVGTGALTGQGVKGSLTSGLQAAGSGGMGAGGLGQIAKTVGKNVAVGAGGQLAAKGLTKAGVPTAAAQQGGNVFSNYLGGKFNGQAISNGVVQSPGASVGFGASPRPAAPGGVDWKGSLLNAGVGAASNYAASRGTAPTTATGLPDLTGSHSPQPRTATTGATYPNGNTGGTQQAPNMAPAASASGQPASWQERWGPLIAQGAGVAVGAYAGKKATDMAQKRSPEEQAALTGAQGAAGNLGRMGGEAWRGGRETLEAPGQYFKTLLSGNRAAMSQAIAGPAAQITGNYRGAQRALDQQGVRGAARDVAVGDLNRDRVSKIAGLTTGMQPYAAEQLKSMGETQQALAPGMTANSGSIYSGLLGQGAGNREYARKEGGQTAAAIGGLARDAGEVVFKRPQGGVATPETKTQSPPAQQGQPQGGTSTPPPVQPVMAPTPYKRPVAATGYPSTNVPLPTFGGPIPPAKNNPWGNVSFGY